MPSIFINPQTALLLAPLISSSCSLWFAWDQDHFLSTFSSPSVRRHSSSSNALIPHYFKAWFGFALPRVVGLLGITTWASVGSIYVARGLLERRGSLGWYVATAVLAVGHLGYVPGVVPSIKRLVEEADRVERRGGEDGTVVEEKAEGEGDKNIETLKEWLWVNRVRMVTTDLGAWLCAFVAVAKTLAVEE